jgi:hypothetical protein
VNYQTIKRSSISDSKKQGSNMLVYSINYQNKSKKQ